MDPIYSNAPINDRESQLPRIAKKETGEKGVKTLQIIGFTNGMAYLKIEG